jgi:hypothetical protein
MIELRSQRVDHRGDLAVVDQVVSPSRHVALDDHVHAKRVAVHSPAFVTLGKRRQMMRRFKRKGFRKTNVHVP